MSASYSGDLTVTGAITAGNVAYGAILFRPEPDTPTSFEVTGLSLRGEGDVHVQITPHTSVPGSQVMEMTVTAITPGGFTGWVYRTTDRAVWASWLAWRDPA